MRGVATKSSVVTRSLSWLRIAVPTSWLQSARRTDRPWLALVLVPILMAAAVLTLHLWLLPVLIALCWWWASTDDPWAFVLGILEAAWGVQWGAIGIYLLAAYPNNLVTVVAIWFCYAFGMAGIGAVNRIRFHRRYGL